MRNVSAAPPGFSVLELVLVVGLLGAIAGFTIIISIDSYQRFAFWSERDTIVALLQRARSQAMSNTNGQPHCLRVQSGQYIIFPGSAPGGSSDVVVRANDALTVTPTLADVVFEQLSGDVNSSLTIALADTSGHHATIVVNTEGRIDW